MSAPQKQIRPDADRAQPPMLEEDPKKRRQTGQQQEDEQAAAQRQAQPQLQAYGGVASGVPAQANAGVQGTGAEYPHRERIESSFGQPVGAQAHEGAEAKEACADQGAEAYTVGNQVAFGSKPDLHTAAHEAAHVVQQRQGAQVEGGVGREGDAHERQADQAADLVSQGKSANHLFAGAGGGGEQPQAAVQKKQTTQLGVHHETTPEDMWNIYHPAVPRGHAPPEGVTDNLNIGKPPRAPNVVYMGEEGWSQAGHHEHIPGQMTQDDLENGPHFGGHLDGPQMGGMPRPQAQEPKAKKMQMTPEIMQWRERVYGVWQGETDVLFGFLHNSAPQIKNFHNAEKDPILAEVHGLDAGKGDLESRAGGQIVPKGKGSNTVDSVFKDGKGPSGSEANTKGLDDNLDKAKKDDKVIGHMMNIKTAEVRLDSALEGVMSAQTGLSAAGHHLSAMDYAVKMETATEKKEAGEANKAALEAKAAKIKGLIGKVISVGSKIAMFAVNPVAGAAAVAADAAEGAGGGGDAKATVDKVAGAASFIGDKIVDMVYGGQIAAAQAQIDAAVADYKAARGGKVHEDWLEAVDLHSKAMHDVLKATKDMQAALVDRRKAYFDLAGVAGAAGGGTKSEQNRVSAMVGAVPVCETVVALTDSILDNWRTGQMSWSVDLGLAMNIQNYADGGEKVAYWEMYLGYSIDYYETFKEKNAFWKDRLKSLRAVMDKMGAGSA